MNGKRSNSTKIASCVTACIVTCLCNCTVSEQSGNSQYIALNTCIQASYWLWLLASYWNIVPNAGHHLHMAAKLYRMHASKMTWAVYDKPHCAHCDLQKHTTLPYHPLNCWYLDPVRDIKTNHCRNFK